MFLKFKDLVNKLDEFLSDKINDKQLNEWLQKHLVVRKYIPLDEKFTIIEIADGKIKDNMSYENADDDNFIPKVSKEYELSIVFDLLLSYTNTVAPSNYRNSEIYDKIISSGLDRYIFRYCYPDYKRFKKIYDRQVGVNDISLLYSLSDVFGMRMKPEDLEKMRDIINEELDTEKLEKMAEIAKFNNPLMARVVDNMTRTTVKDVMSRA